MSDAKGRVSAFDRSCWTIDERRFCELVAMAVRERRDTIFFNGSAFHAVHLIYRFFLRAKKDLRIFSGNLMRRVDNDGGLYAGMKIYEDGHVLSAVKAFLSDEKGTSLKIVVEEGGLDGGFDDHPLVVAVRELHSAGRLRGSCEILQLGEGRRDELKEMGWPPYHMMIMDRSGYRVELDRENKKAKVNLDGRAKAKKMLRFFDDFLCDGAQRLDLGLRQ